MELGLQNMQNQNERKRGGVQQKLPSKLSCQDRHHSSMAYHLIFLSEYPPFNTFIDELFLKMMSAITGENDFKSLTIPHLKMCMTTECSMFKKIGSSSIT